MSGAGVSQLSWQGLYQGEKEMLDLMLYIYAIQSCFLIKDKKRIRLLKKGPSKIKMNII
jgi:hypothetical protein